jgi:hypothetical protein
MTGQRVCQLKMDRLRPVPEMGTKLQTLNPGISTYVIRIRVCVDYESQVNRFNSEFSETWHNELVDMFDASGVQPESAAIAAENGQIQWPDADLPFQEINAVK